MNSLEQVNKLVFSDPTRKPLICLIGIDGSGKTTHARKIIAQLQTKGYSCKYVWFGAPYLISFEFMILCRTLGLTKTHSLPQKLSYSEHQYYRNKAITQIWPWIRFLDLVVLVSLLVNLPRTRGFAVVCDRFVHDNLVEIMIDIRDCNLHKKMVGKLILRLCPIQSKVFLLDVNEEFAFKRKFDLPNFNYLVKRRQMYKSMAEDLPIHIISADRSFSSVNKELVMKINE